MSETEELLLALAATYLDGRRMEFEEVAHDVAEDLRAGRRPSKEQLRQLKMAMEGLELVVGEYLSGLEPRDSR